MIRVLIADDQPALRAGVIQAIAESPDIQVVGEASNGAELWAKLVESKPDVLLLDLLMPDFKPAEEVPLIRKKYPNTEIVVITFYDDQEHVNSMVKAHVAGYLLKEEETSSYVDAIRRVADGGVFFSHRILPLAVGGRTAPSLTRRECEVLGLVAQGMISEEIARELVLAKRTVDFHVDNICRKLGVDSRAAAAAKASELNLITTWKKT